MSSQRADQTVFVLANAVGLNPDSFTLCQSNSAGAYRQVNACQLKGANKKTKCPASMKHYKKGSFFKRIDGQQDPSHFHWSNQSNVF